MKRFTFDHPNLGKLLLRLSLGFLVLLHGIHKLHFGIDFIEKWLVSMNLPAAFSYGVYLGEVVAPILIILGLFTRLASLVLAINMSVAVSFLMSKGYMPFGINNVGGLNAELDFMLLFAALALMCLGGGRFGIKQ